MTYVACIVVASPMRAEASHRSEMVSQLLLGEFAEALKVEGDFTLLKNLSDNYEGWCQSNQLCTIAHKILHQKPVAYTIERTDTALINGMSVSLPLGIPIFKHKKIELENYSIKYKSKGDKAIAEMTDGEKVKAIALAYLHTPYLWGGRSSFGIDCSGLTQQVYKALGVQLPRDAYQQAIIGEDIGFLQEAKCGDLAFFDNEEGRITHVGILLQEKEIIHASGRVRIDKIDSEGIVNVDMGKRTHRLRLIRRMVNGER